MLALLKYKIIFIFRKNNWNVDYKYVIIYGDFWHFCYYSLQWSYSQQPMSDSIEIFWIDIYNWYNNIFPIFVLAFMLLYLFWSVCVIKRRTSNIQC